MDDKNKNAIMMAIISGNAGFMIWWLFISGGGVTGAIVSLLIGAVIGVGGYFATQFLS